MVDMAVGAWTLLVVAVPVALAVLKMGGGGK
jgi:hypothetical protein